MNKITKFSLICLTLLIASSAGYYVLENYIFSEQPQFSVIDEDMNNEFTQDPEINSKHPNQSVDILEAIQSKIPQRVIKADNKTHLLRPEEVDRINLIKTTASYARPTRIITVGDYVYFLSEGKLYRAQKETLFSEAYTGPEILSQPNQRLPQGEPVRELLDIAKISDYQLVLLDKSNDIYYYNIKKKQWSFALKATPSNVQPDPHYVAIKSWNNNVYILDYARNQIHRLHNGTITPYYPNQPMSWELKTGQPNVVSAIDLAVDGNIYTLNRQGTISVSYNSRFSKTMLVNLNQLPHTYHEPSLRGLRESQGYLYITDASNHRVLKLNKQTGKLVEQWILTGNDPEWSKLHDILLDKDGIFALIGNQLVKLPENSDISIATLPKQPVLEKRLQGFTLPISTAKLPDNPGIFPGARRLYRYGIHEGSDFFDPINPQQGGRQVYYGSPITAVKEGTIVRIDHDFLEMSPSIYQSVLQECQSEHETSRSNEDKFRGKQVWIQHEGNITSIYAHLSKTEEKLIVGSKVKQGDVIGLVGNSGTSGSIQNNKINPHLHMEIWLSYPDDTSKGEYLGKWLSLEETRHLWENVFLNP